MSVLVVDDEPAHAEVVAASLERINAQCLIVNSAKEAKEQISRQHFDVVVTDLMLETNDGGLQILKEVKRESPETEVVLMTAFNGVETAVEAMLQGAFNYLQKPLDLKQLRSIVQKAGDAARLRRDNQQLKARLDEKFGFDGVVGSSPAMLKAIERLKRIAPTDATVLILGDTGTGKELFAQALHHNSLRKNKPFVALNCAALSENLLESELFGHLKGAFTDATTDRVGKFEYANGGTIFLDEVGDMPLSTQVKLLRVLESGEIMPVGSNKAIKVNVRLVSATNRNLEEAVESGSFRRDLYHRLKVVTLRLPSLKERRDDLPVLLDHFIRIFSKKYDKSIKGVSQAARRRLLTYDWPGNVRQLRNVAESMVVVDFDGLVDVDDLPDEILEATSNDVSATIGDFEAKNIVGRDEFEDEEEHPAIGRTANGAIVSASPETENSLKPFVGLTLEALERLFIQETLRSTGGNREETAKILGVGERTLYRRIKQFSQENEDAANNAQ
ncbi:MAG: sigma-54-dependent Fis family transcriptional regulator [Thermoguttaceae bacterium]|nr:sigma-54-dependent Fis family transcriptional regulator [Thermoguttaceae bacterium]